MKPITIKQGLPFVTIKITHHGESLWFHDVLINTASPRTYFRLDHLALFDITIEPYDPVHHVQNASGTEVVIEKRLDLIQVGSLSAEAFPVCVGKLVHQLPIDGILGADFLCKVGAQINLKHLIITKSLD